MRRSSRNVGAVNRALAKLPATPRKKAPPAEPSEHKDQAVVMSWLSLNYPDVLAFAVPNAAKRTHWESQRLRAEGMRPGVPDIYIEEARGGWFGLRVEMKKLSEIRAINGGLSDKQLEVREILMRKGYKVVTCYGSEHALKTIEYYLSLLPTVSATLPR
jgi:hypothetical protein